MAKINLGYFIRSEVEETKETIKNVTTNPLWFFSFKNSMGIFGIILWVILLPILILWKLICLVIRIIFS